MVDIVLRKAIFVWGCCLSCFNADDLSVNLTSDKLFSIRLFG